jgi:molybdopterin-guanine dinucleotide biosynthesis protein MobB
MSKILAVCGAKNSGKTTFLEKMIPFLIERGLKIAVIKHDGHDFIPDVPQTDSFRLREAGAYATAVYSQYRYMIYKEQEISPEDLARNFAEADLILIEGLKETSYPKIELIRKEISQKLICNREGLLAIVTDMEFLQEDIPKFHYNHLSEIVTFVYNWSQMD